MYIITSLQQSCGSFNHQIIISPDEAWKLLHLMPGVSESGGAVCGHHGGFSWIPWGAMNTWNFKKKPTWTDRGWRFQADPANFNKQPCRKGWCTKVGMRMGQWAETEVIFIYILYIWFTLNILKLQVVLWQDVREQQQTHLKDAWRITR